MLRVVGELQQAERASCIIGRSYLGVCCLLLWSTGEEEGMRRPRRSVGGGQQKWPRCCAAVQAQRPLGSVALSFVMMASTWLCKV